MSETDKERIARLEANLANAERRMAKLEKIWWFILTAVAASVAGQYHEIIFKGVGP